MMERIIAPPQSRKIKAGRVSLSKNEEVGSHITSGKEEIIIVLKGSPTLIKDGIKTEMKEGNAYYIEPEKEHNVINESEEMAEYIYVVVSL